MTRMEMKKNGSMRAASALMVATLLTTGVLSGTYAKYTTQRSGSDAARVAKWGVVLQVDGSLYGDKYGKGTNIPSDEKTGISVKTEQTTNADAVKNAVAPGTRCAEGLKFSMNGSPEVSTRLIATLKAQNMYLKKGTYALMVKASSVTEKNWKADTYYTKNASVYTLQESYASGDSYMMLDKVTLDADYYPVVYKSARRNNGDTKSDSLNDIAADYAKKLNGGEEVVGSTDPATDVTTYSISREFDPGYNLASLSLSNEWLNWAWTFESGITADLKAKINASDTVLANLQAGTLTNGEVVKVGDEIKAPVEHTDYNLATSFDLSIKMDQID